MAGGDGHSGTAAHFSAASVHVVFQTRPGATADRRITTGGDAALTLRSGGESQVQSVNGIYHFDVPAGDEAVLELFGTQFRIVRVNGVDPDPTANGTLVVWDAPLRPNTGLEGQLQRLQILGYYTGAVSAAMNDLAERAILEFQADNGLVIDGVCGNHTRDKIAEVFGHAGNLNGTHQPLNRRYLACFERANSGASLRNGPQIDFRGGETMKLSLPAPENPAAAPIAYRLAATSASLDEASYPWHLTARGGNGIVAVVTGVKTGSADQFEIRTVSTGDEVLELRQGSAAGPIIATLDVQVVPLVNVELWGHLLTVKDHAGAELANPPMWTEAEARALIDSINDIWNPAGVRFVFRRFESHDVQQPQAGIIEDDYINDHLRSQALASTLNRRGVMNVYFTQRLSMTYTNADGNPETITPLAHAGDRWRFNPSAVFTSKSSDFNMGRVLAHEFGHMLRLTRAHYAHTDDRGVATPWRHDLWSRMRMMSKYVNYDPADPDRNWQNLTYGVDNQNFMLAGDLISVKDLPNDGTDGELQRSRLSIRRLPYPDHGISLHA
jgi:hypothetical protein